MPIRVLHIVTYMGRGGLETMIMNYYRHIDCSKVQFDFLVHRDFVADYDNEILELGGRIYRVTQLNPFSKYYLRQMDNFFKEHKEYKIVHCHLDCMAGIPLKYAKKHGIMIRIAHAHSSSQTKDVRYPLKLFFKQNITRYATQLFACAEAAGKWMFKTDDFKVMNNAINSADYVFNQDVAEKVRSEFGISKGALVIGNVGRFAPPKNHGFIIKVFNEVLRQRKDSVLLLVGEGELQFTIREQVDNIGISEHVIFAGLRSDVNEVLQAMDVFLFPSIYEGLPVSMIEAQAAGLPCLISDKVPIECKKTELVKQISLDEDIDVWVDAVLNAANEVRRDTSDEIRQAGFDIIENAKWLEQFYLNEYSK